METKATQITVEATIKAPVEKVWKYWSSPEHITKWNSASSDWHTPRAENDLRVGGKFSSRMEAKDGSLGFDFGGVYDAVKTNELIEYTMGDGRRVKITFYAKDNETRVTETFDADPHYIFKAVNQFLKASGKKPLFNVQLVGLKKEVKLENSLYTVHAEKLVKDVKKTDLIFIPAISGDIKTALELNRKAYV